MNTLAYFARYNPALWYLALFAATPHPYNVDKIYVDPQTGERIRTRNLPENIPSQNVVRSVGAERDLIEGLKGADKLPAKENARYLKAKKKTDKQGQVKAGQQITPAERQALRKANILTREKEILEQDYNPQQIQAVQRKHLLREKALKLKEQSGVFPGSTKGEVVEASYNALRDPKVRDAIKDMGVLDRYARGFKGQLTETERAAMQVNLEEAQAAKQRLSQLSPEEWEWVKSSHRGLNEVRRGAEPVQEVISEKTSPINRPAKPDVVNKLKKETAARQGMVAQGSGVPDMASPAIPSYVENPESVRYAINRTPENMANSRKPMQVGYTPSPPRATEAKPKPLTGLERRLQRIERAKELVDMEQLPMSAADAVRTQVRKVLPGMADPLANLVDTNSAIEQTVEQLGGFDPDIRTPYTGDVPPPIPRRETLPRPEDIEPLPFMRPQQSQNSIPIDPTTTSTPIDADRYRAVQQGNLPRTELTPDEQRRLLQNTPVAPKPSTNTSPEVQEGVRNWVRNNPPTSDTANSPNAPKPPRTLKGKDYQTKRNLKELAYDAGQKARDTVSNIKNSLIQTSISPLDAETPPPVTPPSPSPSSTPPSTPVPDPTVTSTPPKAPKSKVVLDVSAATGGKKNTPSSVSDNYDKLIRDQIRQQRKAQSEAAQTVASKAKPQSLKLKNLMSGFPNLSTSQKRGLLKLGGGLAGAGGVLLGGSMLANSLIKRKAQDDVARQNRLYGNVPAYQPPVTSPNPYAPPVY